MVSIERAGEIIIPQQDTRFEAGDIVTVFGRKDVLDQVQRIFSSAGEEDS